MVSVECYFLGRDFNCLSDLPPLPVFFLCQYSGLSSWIYCLVNSQNAVPEVHVLLETDPHGWSRFTNVIFLAFRTTPGKPLNWDRAITNQRFTYLWPHRGHLTVRATLLDLMKRPRWSRKLISELKDRLKLLEYWWHNCKTYFSGLKSVCSIIVGIVHLNLVNFNKKVTNI